MSEIAIRKEHEVSCAFFEPLYYSRMQPNAEYLMRLIRTKMPYGKYKGSYLIDLPEPYVVWLHNKALPAGELGQMIIELYDIKRNGLENDLRPLLTTEFK